MTKDKNNFWNACPRQLQFFPEAACNLGHTATSKNPEKGCPWFINSEEDQYCFWTWVRRQSDGEGEMPALLHQDISELLNCSTAKLQTAFKSAMLKLKLTPESEDLEDETY